MESILFIQIDTVPEVEQFISGIQALPPREQCEQTRRFVQSKFKNAANPNLHPRTPADVAMLKHINDQDSPRPLSECLRLGYGYCVEYNVLAKVILDRCGITCEFQVCTPYPDIGHTFLDINIYGAWEIFDAFAEVFLHDKGLSGALLPDIWYTTSRTKKGT